MISKKHKNITEILIYTKKFVILVSVVAGCVSLSDFASLAGISIGNTSSVIELNICAITAGIWKYKSIN